MDFSKTDYSFRPPPECPIFEPTTEEFKDAAAYIEKIRPEAEYYGICKIRPPPEWQPPFSVDIDKLRFTPRIQRLSELEAHTRIRLNFLDQVAKFWELQGSLLTLPFFEGRPLDVYYLRKYTLLLGGFEAVCSGNLWPEVAAKMGFKNPSSVSNGLKIHYEKLVYPFDVFEKEKREEMERQEAEKVKNGTEAVDEKMYEQENEQKKRAKKGKDPKTKMAGRMMMKRPDQENEKPSPKKVLDLRAAPFCKELSRLQFVNAGPKMASLPLPRQMSRGEMTLTGTYDPLSKYVCQKCGKGDCEDKMLLCDGCDDSYHTFCLNPPMLTIPSGDWRCPKCIAAEVSKPIEAFGFEQASQDYTLTAFGYMADRFKQDYFKMPVHLITTTMVEKEYWRILDNIDETVMVEYGADLHTVDHGSGFPTVSSKNLSKEDEVYAKSEWNLNNLPTISNSILRHIDIDISGMKIPWMYVGMCFSTFCWHTEDHWTPSINYLHWGEPKTWYGIGARHAEKAEKVMMDSAKELFAGTPDLLHHIVTTMNPNILQSHDIDVYRMDQYPGEFMITFPRAYHAGFNHGYNLAEAVNFAPPDWLDMGRKCVEHYSVMKRYNVFCHDELVCKMATNAKNLTLQVAAATYKDMITMVQKEREYRMALVNGGVYQSQREAFEILPDEERQCAVCKTTIFLSAITAVGAGDIEIMCLRHFKSLKCDPEILILRYRYTLDELAKLLDGLKARADGYDQWIKSVERALEAKHDDRLEFSDFRGLLDEAVEGRYPQSQLLEALTLTVEEAEKCQTVAHQLGNRKVRTRTRGVIDAKYRLTVDELQLFATQLETLPVKVDGKESVDSLLKQVALFQKEAKELLLEESPDLDALESCINMCLNMDVELPELNELKEKEKLIKWLEDAESALEPATTVDVNHIKEVLEEGKELAPDPAVERELGKLQGLLTQISSWETEAKACISAKPPMTLQDVEKLVEQGEAITSGMPSLAVLKESVRKAREWLSKAEAIKNNVEDEPLFEFLESLVAKGKNLPIFLSQLEELEQRLKMARDWREKLSQLFVMTSSQLTLIDVLLPRIDIGNVRRKKRPGGGGAHGHPLFADLSPQDSPGVNVYIPEIRKAYGKQLESILEFREKNRMENLKKPSGSKDLLMECDLCLENVLPEEIHIAIPESKKVVNMRTTKWLCKDCFRSRRPRIDAIMAPLVELQEFRILSPEGEAFRCLADNILGWQKNAKNILTTEEVVSATRRLGDESQWPLTSHWEGKFITLEDRTPPEIKLSAKTIKVLEEMMVTGDSMEVCVPEKDDILKLLSAVEPRRSRKFPDLKLLVSEIDKRRENKMKAKRKRRVEEVLEAEETKTPKKVKTEPKPGREMRCRQKRTEKEEEFCAARPKCTDPLGVALDWIQCDICVNWYHFICIGLKAGAVGHSDKFICKWCPASGKKK